MTHTIYTNIDVGHLVLDIPKNLKPIIIQILINKCELRVKVGNAGFARIITFLQIIN